MTRVSHTHASLNTGTNYSQGKQSITGYVANALSSGRPEGSDG